MLNAFAATLRSLATPRACAAALFAGSLLLLGGCATSSATNQSQYGQRTGDVKAVDDTIEHQVEKALEQADARLGDARIRAHSYNGRVLLVGQVPSEELQQKAAQVAEQLRGVETVHNELAVAARLPASQRLTDTWLTTNVVSQLATNDHIDSSKLKVTTENASVYLMGIVSRQEAERIVAAVSGVSGVQRIVKVFEYLDGSAAAN
ncbi:BON domain-containing protein [Halomonas piscis]|uniref:BON domain-containing protein n=1 Tax=Halomonas piscis TaxID=3031727 RepID=A0ABY9Z3F6_9GAMM|nr:BON domain-containing protein [Halomonas piscis]WNK21417.1 BON domain-containing protein [Halomonas piscis]